MQCRYYVQAHDVKQLERLAAEVERALTAARQIQEADDGHRAAFMDNYDSSIALIRTFVVDL